MQTIIFTNLHGKMVYSIRIYYVSIMVTSIRITFVNLILGFKYDKFKLYWIV